VNLAVLIGAFVAGVLTTLAPCVLPLLPVIVGGSVAPPTAPTVDGRGGVAVSARVRAPSRRALLIVGSLGVSVVVFTLLLKASTSLLGVPPQVWQYVSGGILVALGLAGLFPAQWDRVSAALRLQGRSTERLARADAREGDLGAILTGAALGPVFSSCSPLYAYVVVTVLPASFGTGLVLLSAYVVGLCATLLAIALLGQKLVRRLGWAADPHGWFRRGLGLVFLLVGIGVMLGWDRALQTWIIENSPWQPWNLDSGFIPEDS
jgi:cytochrome c biogenesis protein CcdA